MLLDRLADRAEDDARLFQLFLEGGGDRYAVEHGVDGDAGKRLLLLEGDAELVEGLHEFGVELLDFLEAAGAALLLGRGVVVHLLVVDRGETDLRPARLLVVERGPVAVGAEAPLQHPVGLVLLSGDEADDVFVDALGGDVLLDLGDEPPLVLAPQLALGAGAGDHLGRCSLLGHRCSGGGIKKHSTVKIYLNCSTEPPPVQSAAPARPAIPPAAGPSAFLVTYRAGRIVFASTLADPARS